MFRSRKGFGSQVLPHPATCRNATALRVALELVRFHRAADWPFEFRHVGRSAGRDVPFFAHGRPKFGEFGFCWPYEPYRHADLLAAASVSAIRVDQRELAGDVQQCLLFMLSMNIQQGRSQLAKSGNSAWLIVDVRRDCGRPAEISRRTTISSAGRSPNRDGPVRLEYPPEKRLRPQPVLSPLRTISVDALAPLSSPRASTMMDLPAPVSPDRRLRPALK